MTRKEYRAQWYQQNKNRLQLKDQAKIKQEKGIELSEEESQSLLPKKYEKSNLVAYTTEEEKEESRVKRNGRSRKLSRTPKYQRRQKNYYQKNKEKIIEYGKEYRTVNADEVNAKGREKNKTPESIAYRKAYYQKRKEKGYYVK